MSVIVKKADKNEFEKTILEIFEELNFKPFGKIFIKPNLSARPPIQRGENTSLEFIEALINVLKEKAGEIIIGHSSLLGTADKIFPYEEVIKSSGFYKLEKLPKVKLLNLDNIERVKVEVENFTFRLPKFLVNKEINFYINVGALKTHMETTVSLTIKNQMGLLIGAERKALHHGGELEKGLACLGKAIKPDFNFIDGLWGMEGNGPHHGLSKRVNLIIAGDDMVEIDSLASAIIGLDFQKIEHLYLSQQLGAGKFVIIETIEKYKNKAVKFRFASQNIKIGKNIIIWPTDSCSQCITALNEAGKLYTKNIFRGLGLMKKAYLGNKKIHLVIGNAKNLDLKKEDKIIAIGQCPKKFAQKYGIENLDKCPPTAEETFKYLLKKIKE